MTLDHTTHRLGSTRRWAHGDGRTGQVEHPLDDRVSDLRVDEAMRQQASELGAVSERDFQRQVIELAETMGWELIYHTHDSRRSREGFPDLIMVRDGRLLALELKTETGRATSRAEGVDRRDAAGDRRARSDRAPAGSAGARGRCAQRMTDQRPFVQHTGSGQGVSIQRDQIPYDKTAGHAGAYGWARRPDPSGTASDRPDPA